MKCTSPKHHVFTACRLLLLIVLILPCLAGVFNDSAEAASYKVYHHLYEEGIDHYYVYKNKSELDETPTFISTSADVYYSENRENAVRITFYRSFNIHSDSQADAFYKYLLKQSSASQRYAGWYCDRSSKFGYEEKVTIAYLIEGLNPAWDYYFYCLWDWNPFKNAYGTSLSLEYLSKSNQWENIDQLRAEGCSAVMTILGDHDVECSSFCMFFREGIDRHIVQRYCVYESWD